MGKKCHPPEADSCSFCYSIFNKDVTAPRFQPKARLQTEYMEPQSGDISIAPKASMKIEPPAGVTWPIQQQSRLPVPKILLDVGAAFVKEGGKNAARSGLAALRCIGCYNNAALSGLHRTLF